MRPMTMTRTVAVLNQKGGVGKTTVTLGLASAGAAAGRRVLVVDLDPQASSTWVLGIEPLDGAPSTTDVLRKTPLEDAVVRSPWSDLVEVLPARRALQDLEDGKPRRLAKALDRADLERYEVVLIDCPPSLGNLTTNALAAARHALVVVEPSALGLRGIGAVADSIDEAWDRHNPDLELSGVVLNRVPAVSNEARRRTAELSRIVGRSVIWAPPVPQRVLFAEAVGDRRPIHSYGWRATEPVEVFDRLWARLRRTVRR
jgi:cellulose biosynthesis protein BcsQ